MRTVVPRYARYLPGVKHLRQDLIRCGNWEEFDAVLRNFFSDAPSADRESTV
jgi:hypothetical protein